MDILIDALAIVNQPTGVGNYSLKLLENLLKIDRRNKYSVIVQKKLNPRHPVFNLELQFLKANIPAIGPKRQLFFPFLFKKHNKISCDIFHCLTPYLPLFQNFPSIVTVHGLTYLKYPHFLGSRLKFWYLKGIMKRACQKAVKVIAISENTKKDIVEILKIDPSKIKIIYQASWIKKPEISPEILPQVKKPYVLYVGEKRPHKNIEGLIRAFHLFKNNDKWGTSLVLAGPRYGGYDKFLDLIKELDLEKDIISLDKVSDEELMSLYTHADLFTLISFYEGFGVPPIEAMKFGVPVIVSNIDVLNEITGDAALAVNPSNHQEIAGAIFRVFNSPALREELIKKGFLRSENFSEEKTARETLKTYQEVYQQISTKKI